MKSIDIYLDDFKKKDEPISMCLGYFDGVHLGHQHLLDIASKNAKHKLGVLIFDKPVARFIDNNKSKEVLTSLTDKFRLISRFDLSYFFILHLTKEFLNKSPLEFILFLKDLGVKEIFAGSDYRFGKNRMGDVTMLKQYFDVHVIDLVFENNEKISSSKIISLLKDGNVKYANELLNHNYTVNGIVIKGYQNGTKFGIKTANIRLDDNYVLPRFGVYKTIIYIDGRSFLCLSNVGVHPTIDKIEKPIIEVHIPHFDEVLYNKVVYIEFLDFIRDEKVFSSTEELIKQSKSDLTLIA